MKTCLVCGEIFSRKSTLEPYSHCPKFSCNGYVVEIDDSILSTIQILNRKGYKTECCCSGYTWGSDPSIHFYSNINENSFQSIPKNFTSKIDKDGRYEIILKISSTTAIERLKSINEGLVDLLEWATNLQTPKSIMVQFDLHNGFEPIEFKKLVEDKLHLFDLDMFEDDGRVFQLYKILVSPDRFEQLCEDVNSFSDANDVIVDIIEN